ncbi:MAG TPA: amidohydrolase family protein [Streptosporangiaceae bacterium]|nr:amidohydrolase family protein [Streptosporangiaceae bacterium]
MTTPVLDSHVHLLDPGQMSYPWLPVGDALNQTWDAARYAAAAPCLAGVIVVEAGVCADQAGQEIAFARAQADTQPWILGIVAQAPAGDPPALTNALAEIADDDFVAGIRWNLQDMPPGSLRDPGLLAGVRLLAEAGLPFDACVRSWQLAELDKLAAACPGTVIVLDHAGKPRCGGDLTGWQAGIRALAARPNIRCKLSGLGTEAAPEAALDDLLGAVIFALAEFGADRCLYGSDWPICTLATSPRSWLELVAAGLEAMNASTDEREQVLAGTALATYRVPGGRTHATR